MSQSQKIAHIKVGRRAKKEENLQKNWESLDVNKLNLLHGKILAVFGGNTTNDSASSNGNAKCMESTIDPEIRDKVKIYSFSYDSEPITGNGYLSKEYANESLLLYEKVFYPILFDDNGYMKEKKGIEYAFNKLTFSSHCGGSAFVNVIIDGLYDTLCEKYNEKTADMLVNKIEYFAYAPSELPNHNVNALIVLPYEDTSYSFIKALELAEEEKIDTDYPKGSIKRLLKAKNNGTLRNAFVTEFKSTRAIMFKIGNSTFMIPNQMNPNKNIGDHSIECFTKSQFLNSDNDCSLTAKLVNFSARTYINEFLSGNIIDSKKLFSKITDATESLPTTPISVR